jgi:ferredoxin-NADP reductase
VFVALFAPPHSLTAATASEVGATSSMASEANQAHAMNLLRISVFDQLAEGVQRLELVDPTGSALPPFTAGSHVDLSLGNGLRRSYSLVNRPSETSRYVIAVAKDARSRGGSAFIHHALRVGETIGVSRPRNNFPLVDNLARVRRD